MGGLRYSLSDGTGGPSGPHHSIPSVAPGLVTITLMFAALRHS